VRDRYYDWKIKSSSRLSGGCVIVITIGKKALVVYLAGARLLLQPEKKSSSCLSGGGAITPFLPRVQFTQNYPIFMQN
jgi:hypothetical protein